MSHQEYPLWCVDRGIDYDAFDNGQYLGPYPTKKEADAAAEKAWREHCLEEDDRERWPCEFMVRACRPVASQDLPTDSFLKGLSELVEEHLQGDACEKAWGDWEESVVEVGDDPAARKALATFIDTHVRCKAYLCEPEPENAAA